MTPILPPLLTCGDDEVVQKLYETVQEAIILVMGGDFSAKVGIKKNGEGGRTRSLCTRGRRHKYETHFEIKRFRLGVMNILSQNDSQRNCAVKKNKYIAIPIIKTINHICLDIIFIHAHGT